MYKNDSQIIGGKTLTDFANDRGRLVKLSRNQDVMAAVPTRDMHLRAGFLKNVKRRTGNAMVPYFGREVKVCESKSELVEIIRFPAR